MSRILVLFALATLLILAACAGSDDDQNDKVPPVPPILVPHLGDTGDPPQPWGEQGTPIILTEENNGIDAVPDGDWIRVLWDPFKDNDLSHIKIWRFDEFNPVPVQIDSIPSSARYYLDTSQDITERVWYSYYIDLVDLAGNSSRSDTTYYALLGKSMLISPADNATIPSESPAFRWNRNGNAGRFRLMLFDLNGNYVYHQDLDVSNEVDPLQITLPANLDFSGQSLRWRIDSMDWDQEKQMFMGSESIERVVYIQ